MPPDTSALAVCENKSRPVMVTAGACDAHGVISHQVKPA